MNDVQERPAPDPGELRQFNVRLPRRLAERIYERAWASEKTMSELVAQLLTEGMDRLDDA